MSVFGKIVYGLQVAAIGLVVVFLGLTILICAVKVMGKIMESIAAGKEAKAKAAAAAAAPAQPAAAPAPAVQPQPEPAAEEVTDEGELIAVIAAAIAAFTDSDKTLVVRRVRRVAGWNRASRAEQVYRF